MYDREKDRMARPHIIAVAQPIIDAIKAKIEASGHVVEISREENGDKFYFTIDGINCEYLYVCQQFNLNRASSWRSFPVADMIEFTLRSVGWNSVGGTEIRGQTWKQNKKTKAVSTDKIAEKLIQVYNYNYAKQMKADREKTNKMALCQFGLDTRFKEYGNLYVRESSNLEKPLKLEIRFAEDVTLERAKEIFNALLSVGLVEQKD